MSKTRVAVLFGGRSPEHDVSVVSGLQALNALDAATIRGFPGLYRDRRRLADRRGLRNRAPLYSRRGGAQER